MVAGDASKDLDVLEKAIFSSGYSLANHWSLLSRLPDLDYLVMALKLVVPLSPPQRAT